MEPYNGRRLTRSLSDRRLAGVCGGLGAYLNLDPTILRILFLVLLLCGGSGGLIYLICWIATPEE